MEVMNRTMRRTNIRRKRRRTKQGSVHCIFTRAIGSHEKRKGCSKNKESWVANTKSEDQNETCGTRGLTLPQCSLDPRWLFSQNGYATDLHEWVPQLILLIRGVSGFHHDSGSVIRSKIHKPIFACFVQSKIAVLCIFLLSSGVSLYLWSSQVHRNFIALFVHPIAS